MPLHKIPLCNVKYVRDIYSSATFQYDTTAKIHKDKSRKDVCVKKVIEIEKIDTEKRMYKDTPQIDKSMVKRSLVAQIKEINVEHSREYERESPDMDKSMISKELEPPEKELNKSELLNLEFQHMREIAFTTSKNFDGETRLIDYSQLKALQIPKPLVVNKVTNLNVSIDKTHRCNIDKICEKNIAADSSIELNKTDTLSLSKDSIMELSNYRNDPLLEFIYGGELYEYDVSNYIDRINESEIIKDHTDKLIEVVNLEDIIRDDAQRYVVDETIIDIGYDNSAKLFRKDIITPIRYYDSAVNLDRITEKYIDKDKNKRLFYRTMIQNIDHMKVTKLMQPINIIPMLKSRASYLDRLHITNVSKINGDYLDRLHMSNVFKVKDKYTDRMYVKHIFELDSKFLNDLIVVPMYKEYQKSIIDIPIQHISMDHSMYLNKASDKEIYLPRENKFIEVTKRWWWLNETSPEDHLIVPNKDYGQMASLLNNYNYEYLRYSNHPIEWGQGWGKDTSIPPAAISIEIMVDLVNIIIMIWHKNVQGWLRVSGKEAIQLLMELIYDWYNMNTSSPNHSYYRAYRWIRWEAEKVYFMNTTSGLQAIGILVKNLRDYLKIHHFNRVPIWRNPRAMDEERNYNRLAQNGDLMVPLDKNKGKRHYFIESQNFDKKNKLIQEQV